MLLAGNKQTCLCKIVVSPKYSVFLFCVFGAFHVTLKGNTEVMKSCVFLVDVFGE